MTKKVLEVTDLGPGDGGKGGGVHAICGMYRAHTVIKRGGAQGSHGVSNSVGKSFAFSQFGCGTLEGVRTHISPQFIMHPEGLLNEAGALHEDCGVDSAFSLLTVDERSLCATELHGISSRLKEMALGKNPRGTIGTGVGETYRYSQSHPELAIRARDLCSNDMRDRLFAVRRQIQDDLAPIIAGGFLPEDEELVAAELTKLQDDGLIDHLVARFRTVGMLANVRPPDFFGDVVLKRPGVAVVENSHGILTDHYMGFHPHTSAIRTLPRFTLDMFEEACYSGAFVRVAIHRAYTIRHGAGPMPTADPAMGEALLPGSHKDENRYQGKVRVGPLDLVLLRYAIAASGGPKMYDALAISWFDQVVANGEWHLCQRYETPLDSRFFLDGELKVRHGEDAAQLEYSQAMGQELFRCRPHIATRSIPQGLSRDQLFDFCAGTLRDLIPVPVRMISLGPTELDKLAK